MKAKEDAEKDVQYYKISDLDSMNKVQVTCLPWIRFSNFKDAINGSEKFSKPKICWGKYYELNGEYYIDLSILVNHVFQDGYHIGMLINILQENILKTDYNVYMRRNVYAKTNRKY